jgi:hypothetical protein
MFRLRATLAFTCLSLISLAFAQANRDPKTIAKKCFDLLMQEHYTDFRAMCTQQMQAGLTETVLKNKLGPQLKSLGAVKNVGDPTSERQDDMKVDAVTIPVQFDKAAVNFQFSVDDEGKLAGLRMLPGKTDKDAKLTRSLPSVRRLAFHARATA